MSRIFSNPLTELAEFEELSRDLSRKKGPVQVSGCMDSQKVHLMVEAEPDMPWKLVVTYDEARGPRKSMMISAALPGRSGFIRPRIFCFTARIFMEIC